MAAPDEVEAKPHYGPAMSPAIFANKWLRKFRNLVLAHEVEVDAGHMAEAGPHQMVLLFEEGIELLFNFHAQAKELSLAFADSPNESALDKHKTTIKIILAAEVNPFLSASSCMQGLDVPLRRLKLLKEGGQRIAGLGWRAIPLTDRQRINEVLPKVEEAKESGWWNIDERCIEQQAQQLEQHVLRQMREGSARRAACSSRDELEEAERSSACQVSRCVCQIGVRRRDFELVLLCHKSQLEIPKDSE